MNLNVGKQQNNGKSMNSAEYTESSLSLMRLAFSSPQ